MANLISFSGGKDASPLKVNVSMVIGEIAKVDSTSQVVSLKKLSAAVSASLNFNFLQMVNFCNIYGRKKLSNSCFQWHTYLFLTNCQFLQCLWAKKADKLLFAMMSFVIKIGQNIKVPILKECHFGKMKLWRVEHFQNIFVFTYERDCWIQ